jgi:hypothetical protein
MTIGVASAVVHEAEQATDALLQGPAAPEKSRAEVIGQAAAAGGGDATGGGGGRGEGGGGEEAAVPQEPRAERTGTGTPEPMIDPAYEEMHAAIVVVAVGETRPALRAWMIGCVRRWRKVPIHV